MSAARYYVETEDGRDWYTTEAEARAAAHDAVADIRMDLHDGDDWPDAVESISWGLELGRAVEVARGSGDTACRLCRGEIDGLGVCVDPLCREVTELEEWVDYRPVPHAAVPA